MSICRKVGALVARDEVLVETVLVGPVTKNLISGIMNHDSHFCKSLDSACLRVIVPFEDGCVASVLVLQMFTNGFVDP